MFIVEQKWVSSKSWGRGKKNITLYPKRIMSNNLEFNTLIQLVLPKELNDYFEVKKIEEEKNKIEIFLEEFI
jgi:hypothetical protein